MTPRVAFVVEQLRRRVPGGIGRCATSLLDVLQAYQPAPALTLVASRPPGTRSAEPLARWGFEVRTSGLPGPLLTRAWDHGLLPLRGAYDVVHGVSLVVPPKVPSEGKLVVTVHDLAWRRFPEATTPRGRRWHEGALRRALASADAVVVPTAQLAEELAGEPSVPPATVITWGSDHLPAPDQEGADRLLGRLGVAGPFLLTASTLEPRKNLTRLCQAYAEARRDLPEPWPLIVVGPEGWGAGGPSALPEGVQLAGRVDDAVLAALYRRARAFAYVPLIEGYGFPPVEAMAAGLPVLAGAGVPSAATPSSPGGEPPALVVDPLSVDDIAAGLVRVATEEALRTTLVERGHVVARHHTWAEAARRHVELWSSLS